MFLPCAAILASAPAICADTTPSVDNEPLETVVVSSTLFDAESAPAKSSLNTGQPETILNRPYIENFAPPQADYVTLLAIAPSLTGQDVKTSMAKPEKE